MADQERIEREDRELVRRMTLKDAAALDAFYARYNRLAFTLVFRVVGNRDDAEDVLVDVFWQTWQQAGRYDASRGKPVAWLLTIARTRAIDCTRVNGRRPIHSDPLEDHMDPASPRGEVDAFVLADTR